MGELEKQCYIPGCHACEHVVRGYDSIAKYMKQTGSLLEEESVANIDGIMVRLKRHYDTLQAFKVYLYIYKEKRIKNQHIYYKKNIYLF